MAGRSLERAAAARASRYRSVSNFPSASKSNYIRIYILAHITSRRVISFASPRGNESLRLLDGVSQMELGICICMCVHIRGRNVGGAM